MKDKIGPNRRRSDDAWLNWQALVAVSAIPASCGILYLGLYLGRSVGLDGGAVFQGLCSLLGAGVGFGLVSYQIRKSFENERELRRKDRLRRVRDQAFPLRDALASVRATAKHGLEGLYGANAKDKGLVKSDEAAAAYAEGFREATLSNLIEDDLSSYQISVNQTENPAFQGGFARLMDEVHVVRLGGAEMSPERLREQLEFIEWRAKTLLYDFDNVFPPE